MRFAALPLGEAAIHLVVERTPIAQQRQWIGAGDGGLRFEFGGLPLQPDFGGGQLLLQPLVGLDDVVDRFQDHLIQGRLLSCPLALKSVLISRTRELCSPTSWATRSANSWI